MTHCLLAVTAVEARTGTQMTSEAHIRRTYLPFLLDDAHSARDWVARLELSTTLVMVDLQSCRTGGDRPKILSYVAACDNGTHYAGYN